MMFRSILPFRALFSANGQLFLSERNGKPNGAERNGQGTVKVPASSLYATTGSGDLSGTVDQRSSSGENGRVAEASQLRGLSTCVRSKPLCPTRPTARRNRRPTDGRSSVAGTAAGQQDGSSNALRQSTRMPPIDSLRVCVRNARAVEEPSADGPLVFPQAHAVCRVVCSGVRCAPRVMLVIFSRS